MSDIKIQQFIGIKQLVAAFDSDNGIPGDVFDAACTLIEAIMNIDAKQAFTLHLDATDDNFYFDTTTTAETCWAQMLHAAGLDGTAYDFLHDLMSKV